MPPTSKPLNKESDHRASSRRQRNVDSAKRSKDRLKNEHKWMEVQMSENEGRVRELERRARDLASELEKPSKNHRSVKPTGKDNRPAWFGEPF